MDERALALRTYKLLPQLLQNQRPLKSGIIRMAACVNNFIFGTSGFCACFPHRQDLAWTGASAAPPGGRRFMIIAELLDLPVDDFHYFGADRFDSLLVARRVLSVGKARSQIEVACVAFDDRDYGFGRDRNPLKSVALP
jgi:hypothetical protein